MKLFGAYSLQLSPAPVKRKLIYTRAMAQHASIPAVVLAAGASTRLGHPKQLVRIADETLIDRTIRIAHDAGASPVFAVLGAHRQQITAAAKLENVQLILNQSWKQGIASSIIAGLQAIAPDASGVLFLVSDQPALSAAHLSALIAAFHDAGGSSIAASSYAGGHGIPAIFPCTQFARLLQLTGDSGAKVLLINSDCAIASVSFEAGALDIDTEQDLQAFAEQDRSC